MDTTFAVYFSVIAALMVMGGIIYQAKHWDTVEKAPKEITPAHNHHH